MRLDFLPKSVACYQCPLLCMQPQSNSIQTKPSHCQNDHVNKPVRRKKPSQSPCKHSIWELSHTGHVQSADPPQPAHTAATCSFRKSMRFPFPFYFHSCFNISILHLVLHVLFTDKLSESTPSTHILVFSKRTNCNPTSKEPAF